ncbi:MAG TPA: hypothetical protein DCQ36_05355 [Actinobacteria bacterium]|nr:hypothetical protein [Actinomycetota bacterium]
MVIQAGTVLGSRWVTWLSVAIVALAVAVVVITTTVRTTDSDMMGSLLAAESLVQGHWLRFDHYPDLVKSALQVGYRLEEVNGHLYYFFPIGTSLIVAPVIAVLSALGIEVTPNDDKIQIALAAVASVLVFVLTYLLARRFLRHWVSLLIATAFWFGSSFASTGATALWSHDFGAVMSLGALLCLVVALQGHRTALASWSGVLAAYAFVVRPQLALLPLGIAILLAVRWRRGLVAFAWPAALVVAAFVVFTKLTSGVWLPAYYLPQRLEGGDFWVAFTGNMVSPGRGLLLFTPILLVLLLLWGNWRRITGDERALVILGVLWTLAHWIAISRFPHWWGGWGFGPRLMMDALPGLVLVVVVLWPRTLKPALAKVTVIVFVVLAAVSTWINTVQALYNPYSRVWYVEPISEDNPWIMWDWQYPQLLASEDRHEDRMQRLLSTPPPLQPRQEYPVGAPELGLVGWSTGFWSNAISLDPFRLGIPSWWPEEGRRWSEGATARIVFTMPDTAPSGFQGRFEIPVDAYGPQRVDIALDGRPVGSSIVEGAPGEVTPGRVAFTVDPVQLGPGEHLIELSFPTRVTVGKVSDFREIAVAVRGLSLK